MATSAPVRAAKAVAKLDKYRMVAAALPRTQRGSTDQLHAEERNALASLRKARADANASIDE
jgi:hypothetical protein